MPDSDREQGKEEGGGGGLLSTSTSGQSQNAGRQNLVKYGELVILGYNGQLPQGKKERFNETGICIQGI
jgi:hypothetical protein